jgi:glycerol kinase
VKVTFGTGAFLLAVAGERRPQISGLSPTIAWRLDRQAPVYAIEGGVYDAGAALEWARGVGLYSEVEELDRFDGASALSRGLVFVPALSGLAAPYWDRKAAPLFIGMEHATSRRDLARAALEGVALLTAALIEAATQATTSDVAVSIDGGLSQSAYFAQFLASAAGRPIVAPAMHELTALGLAELCGVDVAAARASARTYAPDGAIGGVERGRFAAAVERARGWRD